MLGLPGAPECSQVQPSAELTSQVLPNAPKNPNTKSHAAVDASIKFVAVNNAKNPCKIRLYDGFYNSTF